LRSKALVADEKNSLAILVYQLEPTACQGDDDCKAKQLHQAASIMVLQQVISEKAFNQLRTKESLGYVVWAWVQPEAVEDAPGKVVYSLRLLVQSGVKGASYVRERMAAFMDLFAKQVEPEGMCPSILCGQADAVTDADIENAKKGLIAGLLKRPDSLGEEGNRIWTEVAMRREDWARPWHLAEIVPTLTLTDTAAVLKQFMQPGMPGRRAAIEVWSATDGDPFSNSASALHLDDAAAMQTWKKKVGSWMGDTDTKVDQNSEASGYTIALLPLIVGAMSICW